MEHVERNPNYTRYLIAAVVAFAAFTMFGMAISSYLGSEHKPEESHKLRLTTGSQSTERPNLTPSTTPQGIVVTPVPTQNPRKSSKSEQDPFDEVTHNALLAEYSTLLGVDAHNGSRQRSDSQSMARVNAQRQQAVRDDATQRLAMTKQCISETDHQKRYECAKSLGYPDINSMTQSAGASAKPVRERKEGEELLPPGSLFDMTVDHDVKSMFAGSVSLTVTQDVYSADRQWIMVPAGSHVMAQGKSSTSSNNSQTISEPRMALMGQLLVYPNGESVDLSDISALLDEDGVAAVKADLQWPWKEWGLGLIFNLATSAPGYMIDRGGGIGPGGFGSPQSQALSGLTQDLSQSGQQVGNRFLNVNPKKTIYANQPVPLRTLRPIYLKPWKRVDETAYEVVQ